MSFICSHECRYIVNWGEMKWIAIQRNIVIDALHSVQQSGHEVIPLRITWWPPWAKLLLTKGLWFTSRNNPISSSNTISPHRTRNKKNKIQTWVSSVAEVAQFGHCLYTLFRGPMGLGWYRIVSGFEAQNSNLLYKCSTGPTLSSRCLLWN